jgi:peptide/nickel transport system substrate-binding protein
VWAGENGSGLLPLLAAGAFTPEAAEGWRAWETLRQNPEAELNVEPVEPPAGLMRQYEILAELREAATPEAQAELMNELLAISQEDFYTLGLSLPEGGYRVIHNTLRNVPESFISGWLYPGPSPINFETFYIDPSFAQ